MARILLSFAANQQARTRDVDAIDHYWRRGSVTRIAPSGPRCNRPGPGRSRADGNAKNTLVFMIDLGDRKDDGVPESPEELIRRQKSIQFGARKKSGRFYSSHRASHRGPRSANWPAGLTCTSPRLPGTYGRSRFWMRRIFGFERKWKSSPSARWWRCSEPAFIGSRLSCANFGTDSTPSAQ